MSGSLGTRILALLFVTATAAVSWQWSANWAMKEATVIITCIMLIIIAVTLLVSEDDLAQPSYTAAFFFLFTMLLVAVVSFAVTNCVLTELDFHQWSSNNMLAKDIESVLPGWEKYLQLHGLNAAAIIQHQSHSVNLIRGQLSTLAEAFGLQG
jgi:hypothetical protein